jgi:hypothetical protein
MSCPGVTYESMESLERNDPYLKYDYALPSAPAGEG